MLATVVENLASNVGGPIATASWAPAEHSSAVESTRRPALQAAGTMGRVSDVAAFQLQKGRIDALVPVALTRIVFSTPLVSYLLPVAGRGTRVL